MFKQVVITLWLQGEPVSSPVMHKVPGCACRRSEYKAKATATATAATTATATAEWLARPAGCRRSPTGGVPHHPQVRAVVNGLDVTKGACCGICGTEAEQGPCLDAGANLTAASLVTACKSLTSKPLQRYPMGAYITSWWVARHSRSYNSTWLCCPVSWLRPAAVHPFSVHMHLSGMFPR